MPGSKLFILRITFFEIRIIFVSHGIVTYLGGSLVTTILGYERYVSKQL